MEGVAHKMKWLNNLGRLGLIATAATVFVPGFAHGGGHSPLERLEMIANEIVLQDLMKRSDLFAQIVGGNRIAGKPECRVAGNISVLFGPGASEQEKYHVMQEVMKAGGLQGMYQVGGRWTQTATNASTGSAGDPITVTWSIVPDGVTIPNAGLGSGPNEINTRMNAQFGGTLWITKVQEAFDRWGELSGVTYIQVSDDGASLHGSPGRNSAPIRGDVRISMFQMSNGNVIAYNFFPNNGDMVLNRSFLSSFGNSTNNYRFLRNTVAHEHGHGLGFDHVDPTNGTKLMEAFLNTNFDHAQSDDIQAIQFNYGDPFENNDTAATRTNLGTVSNNQTVNNLSTDKRSDVDWYRVLVPAGKTLSITITPEGGVYQQGPQGGSVTTRNANAVHQLRVTAFLADGTTQLGSTTASAAGQTAILSNVVPPLSNELFIRVDAVAGTLNDIQLYRMTFNLAPLTEAYVPQSLTINTGVQTGGNVGSLANSDDDRLLVREAPPLALGLPSIRWSVTSFGRANAPINTITVRVEASTSATPAASVQQRLLLWNWNTNQYEAVDTRSATASDSTYDVLINSNAGRFMNAATGELRARMEWFDPGTLFSFGWISRTDQLRWTIVYQ